MAEKIIELIGITKSYDGTVVVENQNLYIRKGEFLTLLGPYGCGKTKTLRMISGFEIPDCHGRRKGLLRHWHFYRRYHHRNLRLLQPLPALPGGYRYRSGEQVLRPCPCR